MLSPCLFSEKILTYGLFWGIYDVRLSLTINSELFRYKKSLIDSKKKRKKEKKKMIGNFTEDWNHLRLSLDSPLTETCFGNFGNLFFFFFLYQKIYITLTNKYKLIY